MATVEANGVELYYERSGEGEPIALVHGSWTDADPWAAVARILAGSFDVIVYDRRGHTRSERPDSQGSVDEDAEDLAALIGELGIAPAHVATSSHGGNIAMRLAARRPELFRSLSMHEPPSFGALGDSPEERAAVKDNQAAAARVREPLEAGEHEAGARLFVNEIAFGPGAWEEQLPTAVRDKFVNNAPTYLDELRDPGNLEIREEELSKLEIPVQITLGTESPSFFSLIADRLAQIFPRCRRRTIEGASHGPQLSHPEEYARLIAENAGLA